MLTREKRRIATQLNLDPNYWIMIGEFANYIKYKHAVTGEVVKRLYGGECR